MKMRGICTLLLLQAALDLPSTTNGLYRQHFNFHVTLAYEDDEKYTVLIM